MFIFVSFKRSSKQMFKKKAHAGSELYLFLYLQAASSEYAVHGQRGTQRATLSKQHEHIETWWKDIVRKNMNRKMRHCFDSKGQSPLAQTYCILYYLGLGSRK